MRYSIVMIGLFSLSLSGCAGSPVGDALAGPEELARQDNDYCVSIGAAAAAYSQCRMNMTMMRQQRHQSAFDRAAVGMAVAAAASRPAPTVTCTTFYNTTTCR